MTTTNEVDLRIADYDAQLTYVRKTHRVLVTCDARFIARHRAGMTHPGIVLYHANSRSIGEVIAFLALLAKVIPPDEMTNHIEYA